MSKTGLSNPEYYAGPPFGAKEKVRALDGQSWKSGQPCWIDSGYWRPMATDGTRFQGIFADSQASAASSSDVWVQRINTSETQLVAFASFDDSDAGMEEFKFNGTKLGIHVGSNSSTINKNETTATCVTMRFPLWAKEGYKNLSTDDPAAVVFTINDSSLGN